MKTLFYILVLTLTLAVEGAAQKARAGEITEIRFEDEVGFGVEKGFQIRFEKSGATTFHGGRNFYVRKGNYAGAITAKQFSDLAKTIAAHNFFALKNRYEGSTMDVGTRTITVVSGGKEKTVINWGASAQKDFAWIERAIKRLEAQIRWRPADDLK